MDYLHGDRSESIYIYPEAIYGKSEKTSRRTKQSGRHVKKKQIHFEKLWGREWHQRLRQ